jgi:hypothetical protein
MHGTADMQRDFRLRHRGEVTPSRDLPDYGVFELVEQRNISHVKEASKDGLPHHDPLLAKMAASKRGSPSVSVTVRGRPSTPPSQRRNNPMATNRDDTSLVPFD